MFLCELCASKINCSLHCPNPCLKKLQKNELEDDNSVDKDAVLRALNHVQDPDLGRSIVELGFIKRLRSCAGTVAFDIELTTPACPVKEQMQAQALRFGDAS